MIAIPNMKKPKRCIKELDCGLLDEPCLFIDEREACLLQNNSKIGEYEENYKTCPLTEIVTCKECIHKTQALSTEKGATGCELIRGTFYEDFFCKEGERRE